MVYQGKLATVMLNGIHAAYWIMVDSPPSAVVAVVVVIVVVAAVTGATEAPGSLVEGSQGEDIPILPNHRLIQSQHHMR